MRRSYVCFITDYKAQLRHNQEVDGETWAIRFVVSMDFCSVYNFSWNECAAWENNEAGIENMEPHVYVEFVLLVLLLFSKVSK